jgi:hypothetical protein
MMMMMMVAKPLRLEKLHLHQMDDGSTLPLIGIINLHETRTPLIQKRIFPVQWQRMLSGNLAVLIKMMMIIIDKRD